VNAATIAAVATPPGRGAVALIRMTGPAAQTIAARVFKPRRGRPLAARPSHMLVRGTLLDGAEPIDDALAVLMRAPHSYTGEDVVEFHCHGNPLIVDRVLALLATAGARMAERGEFTRRAFLNGRMDLTQAEAVADLVAAAGDGARRAAVAQLAGALAHRLRGVHDELTALLAVAEASIEFPEDMDGTEDVSALLDARVARLRETVTALVRTADMGRMLHDGYRVALAGRPNAGKSSLLNCLAREERALVTEIPGTTRDTLEVDIVIEGFPVRVIDTAGLRMARGRIEQHGVARARAALAAADLIVWVADRACVLPRGAIEDAARYAPPAQSVWVWNKCDRVARASAAARSQVGARWHSIELSARTGEGIETFLNAIAARLRALHADASDNLIILRARQRDLLARVADALAHAHTALSAGAWTELVAEDLRAALQAVGELTGAVTCEDILDRIFAEFCIGK